MRLNKTLRTLFLNFCVGGLLGASERRSRLIGQEGWRGESEGSVLIGCRIDFHLHSKVKHWGTSPCLSSVWESREPLLRCERDHTLWFHFRRCFQHTCVWTVPTHFESEVSHQTETPAASSTSPQESCQPVQIVHEEIHRSPQESRLTWRVMLFS